MAPAISRPAFRSRPRNARKSPRLELDGIFVARGEIGAQLVAQLRLVAGEIEDAFRVLDDIGVRVVVVRLQDLPARFIAAIAVGTVPIMDGEAFDETGVAFDRAPAAVLPGFDIAAIGRRYI